MININWYDYRPNWTPLGPITIINRASDNQSSSSFNQATPESSLKEICDEGRQETSAGTVRGGKYTQKLCYKKIVQKK